MTLEKADGQARLADAAKAVGALTPDIEKLATEASHVQDAADRALGQGANPAVKAALEKLATMDRAAVVAGMLDGQAVKDATGGVQLVQYGMDTDLRELAPDSKATFATDTDLATPLIHIAERHAQDSIAAVVICTDGRHTSGPVPEDAARLLSARGIAVHTLGAGSESAPPDICIARLDGSQSVFMEETIRLTAHIKVSGFKGQKCMLVLSRDEKSVQEREMVFGDDGWLNENFEIPADKPGPNVFTASIKPLPGEALTANNSAEFIVDVANDRLKVLLADELPRWESRYVASLLRRERKMTLDERWLLSGEGLGPKPLALPKEEKALDDYEIIVIGDVPADRLSEADQKRLADFVADRGGFLVLLAGPKSMPQAYLTGPIADLLPIRQQAPASAPATLTSAAATERCARETRYAWLGPMKSTRILRDPALNEKLWTDLPELHWVARPALRQAAGFDAAGHRRRAQRRGRGDPELRRRPRDVRRHRRHVELALQSRRPRARVLLVAGDALGHEQPAGRRPAPEGRLHTPPDPPRRKHRDPRPPARRRRPHHRRCRGLRRPGRRRTSAARPVAVRARQRRPVSRLFAERRRRRPQHRHQG